MKILYIHGFGSRYDPGHVKIKSLEQLGTVVGVDVNYCKGFKSSFDSIMSVIVSENVDLIVGTSMGGYMAAHVGAKAGIPFVALNPATQPSVTLQKWIGTFTDYSGKDQCLSEATATSFPDITQEGAGLVIVESSDEIINASETVDLLEHVFNVEQFKGGSHRFVHIENALPLIKQHYLQSSINYGIDTE